MKDPTKTKRNRDIERDLFAELSEGMKALADARHGKRTLRTHAVEHEPELSVTCGNLSASEMP
jgi:putative transcriptional regulator